MISARSLMNATAHATRLEPHLGLGRAIRAVRIHIRRRVGPVQKPFEFLAVMHTRVVLVAVEALAVLLGPARILVFLPVFRRVLLPFLWCLSGLNGLILFAAITLLGDRKS